MPWVYVGSDTMIDFNVEMAKKIEVSIKFQILKPNSVLTMKMLMRLPRTVMFFPCMPTSHLPTNRLWASKETVGFTLMGASNKFEDILRRQVQPQTWGKNCWESVLFEWQGEQNHGQNESYHHASLLYQTPCCNICSCAFLFDGRPQLCQDLRL